MANLFKRGTEGMDERQRRKAPGSWRSTISLGPYQRKQAVLCTDRATSEAWARMLQAAVDRKNAGEPPDADTIKKLPGRLVEQFELVSSLSKKRRGTLAASVADYVGELETGGRSAMYVGNIRRCLTAVAKACGWVRLTDLDRDKLAVYMAERRADDVSPRTLNNELATLRGFAAWCVSTRRLDANPFASLKRVDTSGERRRVRRAITRDEVAQLLAVAGPMELLIRTALGTGLRRGELAKLQWRDVHIDDARPCLRLRKEATKAKRADTVPIAADLARRLRDARPVGYKPTATVFDSVPNDDQWQALLATAGVTYRDDQNRIVGFHSTRVTYISELQAAGLPVRTIMELARHRDPQLTCQTYTDIGFLDVFGAAAALPTYNATPEAARRTGTDDLPFAPSKARAENPPNTTLTGRQQNRQQKGFIPAVVGATYCTVTDSVGGASRGGESAGNRGKTARNNAKGRSEHRPNRPLQVSPRLGLESNCGNAESLQNKANPGAGDEADNKSGNNSTIHDPDLRAVVSAWPSMPPTIRAAVLALANTVALTEDRTPKSTGETAIVSTPKGRIGPIVSTRRKGPGR